MSITKLIGFKIYNHYLFKDGSYFGIDISGQDTQKTRKSIFSFSNTVKLNKVTSVVGINAVGKTMLINIFSGLSSEKILTTLKSKPELQAMTTKGMSFKQFLNKKNKK